MRHDLLLSDRLRSNVSIEDYCARFRQHDWYLIRLFQKAWSHRSLAIRIGRIAVAQGPAGKAYRSLLQKSRLLDREVDLYVSHWRKGNKFKHPDMPRAGCHAVAALGTLAKALCACTTSDKLCDVLDSCVPLPLPSPSPPCSEGLLDTCVALLDDKLCNVLDTCVPLPLPSPSPPCSEGLLDTCVALLDCVARSNVPIEDLFPPCATSSCANSTPALGGCPVEESLDGGPVEQSLGGASSSRAKSNPAHARSSSRAKDNHAHGRSTSFLVFGPTVTEI